MYYYVISFTLSNPMAIGLIVSLIFGAYIIISFIYYVCIIAPALISHPFTNNLLLNKVIIMLRSFGDKEYFLEHDEVC